MNATLFPRSLLGVFFAVTLLQSIAPAEDDVVIVQPFVEETTILVLKVDPTRLALPDLDETTESLARQAEQGLQSFQVISGGQPVYATVRIPRSEKEQAIFLLVKETPGVDPEQSLDSFTPSRSLARDGRIVLLPQRDGNAQAAVDALVPVPREGLAEAFESVGDYPIQILLLPPDHLRRTVVELMPELPKALGGGPSRLLTEGLVWAALGVDVKELRAELVVQSASAEAARDLAGHLPDLLRGIRDKLADCRVTLPRESIDALLGSIKPQVDGDRFTVQLEGLASIGGSTRLLAGTVVSLYDKHCLQGDMIRFKNIVLEMHNYYDVHKMFPPSDKVRDKEGNTGLSWRVHTLVFEDRNLYDRFHLDEPWDSAHNKTLIDKMPDIYGSRRPGIKPGHTTFLAPTGEDTVFGGNKATRFHDITDGTVNTIVLVEVQPELAVPWTSPQDYEFDPKDPGIGLQRRASGEILAATADGAVHVLPADLDPIQMLRFFQKSDGNVVNW